MSTLKSINVIHPSSATNNIVNDASGNVAIGGALTSATITSPAATALTIQSAGTTAMTVDTSQRVGIGTTSPTSKLHLTGTGGTTSRVLIESTGTVGTAFPSLLFNRNSTTSETFDFQGNITWQRTLTDSTTITSSISSLGSNVAGSATMTLNYNAYTAQAFQIATVEKARIDTNGYLLVGYAASNGAYALQVNSQIFATSATIATSDARYKQNVQTLGGALNLVNALRPVSFDWKKHPVHAFDTENTTVGFLAQEVQQVLAGKPYLNSIVKKNECVVKPEIKDEDGVVTTAAVTEEFLGIAEGNMIAILTSAIQELSAKNDALEARLAALEAK
jgi:hypothetical protein